MIPTDQPFYIWITKIYRIDSPQDSGGWNQQPDQNINKSLKNLNCLPWKTGQTAENMGQLICLYIQNCNSCEKTKRGYGIWFGLEKKPL